VTQRHWAINDSDKALAFVLSRKLHISSLTAQILVNRGLVDIESAHSFLHPLLKSIHDPFSLQDMDKAVSRIIDAVTNNEQIVIFGDYDVDGITATVLLYDFLCRMGAQVDYVLPQRSDGYGFKNTSVDICREKNARIILTVDCGISSLDAIVYAKECGIDVIVSDHHEPGETIPECVAVINPKRSDSSYPFRELSGVGVAFKIAHAVLKQCKVDNKLLAGTDTDLKDYLDLVCLGTVADIVPLLDENRIYVKYGLLKLKMSDRPGIVALKEIAGLDEHIETSHVSYRLAPRINATGRVSLSDTAAQLLLSNKDEAGALAAALDNDNRNRQKIEAEVVKDAFSVIDKTYDPTKDKIIVAYGDNWHQGVIGIVASRIVKKYNRPAVVISFEENVGKGSARSIGQFHILDALRECKEYITNLGGHKGAAGMTIEKGTIDKFCEKLKEVASERLTESDLSAGIDIDCEIQLNELTHNSVKELEKLEPFGFGNPKPVFISHDVTILGVPRIVGKDHLKLYVDCAGMNIDVIGFGMAQKCTELTTSDCKKIDIVYTPTINKFRGEERLQLELYDVKVRTRKVIPQKV